MAKKTPLRQCLGCQEMKSKNDLIRVVKTAEDTFAIDLTGKLNGRGAYICKRSECLNMAINRKSLDRSFKMSIPKEVYDQLKRELLNIEE